MQVNIKFSASRKVLLAVFVVRLATHVSNGCKSLVCPSREKDIADYGFRLFAFAVFAML